MYRPKWALATYDSDNDGLMENGETVPDHFWCLLVGEPYNFPRVPDCAHDVVVVASMEMCELFGVMAAYSAQRGLAASAWLKGHADESRTAIEKSASDPEAGSYYLLYRRPEGKWYHSLKGINEHSRELDVTPYYAALVSGRISPGDTCSPVCQRVLSDYQIFPMPLQYPSYNWVVENPSDPENGQLYHSPYGFVPGDAGRGILQLCAGLVRLPEMPAPLYEAIKRRSEAYVRDQDCREWYTPDGKPRGRDRYGLSAAAHVSAIIEGLFGITPARFGFSEINIHPNFPLKWSGKPAAIRVTLPGTRLLKSCTTSMWSRRK